MGANEARHVLDMSHDLARVLALELYTAAQALDLRRDMINAARALARRSDAAQFAGQVTGAPAPGSAAYPVFLAEEIGSASWRDRVCTSVWISVVAGSLKK